MLKKLLEASQLPAALAFALEPGGEPELTWNQCSTQASSEKLHWTVGGGENRNSQMDNMQCTNGCGVPSHKLDIVITPLLKAQAIMEDGEERL